MVRLIKIKLRRGVRVADGAILERLCGGNSTKGSNPFLSCFKSTYLAQVDFLNFKSPQFVGFCRVRIKQKILNFKILSTFSQFFQKFSVRFFQCVVSSSSTQKILCFQKILRNRNYFNIIAA